MLEALEELARLGRLYPSVVLHGSSLEARLATASRLARILLCEGERTGGACDCRHCRRIGEIGREKDVFHPDLQVLEKDLRTVTSAEATRNTLRAAQMHPFEARGQVFVIPRAETLSDEAANVLLKMLEEPPTSAPRNFFLCTPAADTLLPTLRSRSLRVYLGAVAAPDGQVVAAMAEEVAQWLREYTDTSSSAYLLAAASALQGGRKRDDPRDATPWNEAAAAVVAAYRTLAPDGELAQALLGLAQDLLLAPEMRARGIQSGRILEGLVSRHLGRLQMSGPHRESVGARAP